MNSSIGAESGDMEPEAFKILKGFALSLLVSWTAVANILVFVVLYKNPRLQTVPNLLVGNLAFSDICLGTAVLPFSTIYAIAEEWVFGRWICEIWLSSDILCCTASIWNMSTIGLDRYWAITSPVTYMNKRNKRTAFTMIAGVWGLAAVISLAPFLGWKSAAPEGNYKIDNETLAGQCGFLDLPGYTIYSATGSFLVPTFVMFFVYYKIYRAFAEHRARQIYRQRVIRRHIESTILHEISHVLPTSDEFAKSGDDDYDDDDEDEDMEEEEDEEDVALREDAIIEEDEEKCLGEMDEGGFGQGDEKPPADQKSPEPTTATTFNSSKRPLNNNPLNLTAPRSIGGVMVYPPGWQERQKNRKKKRGLISNSRTPVGARTRPSGRRNGPRGPLTAERVQRHKTRKEREANMRKSLQKKPAAISAAKEKRGVKVLGIILGCFTVCWTPFFTMYVIGQFCEVCRPNIHVEQFITWLGYSNSAMNPIIYTVFNRDYQNALKRLFSGKKSRIML